MDTHIFCLCAFQNRFFHKVKKAFRPLTNSPYPSSRIASPPFSLLPLQNFDLQGHYSTTQPVNNQQQKTTVILPKLRWFRGRSDRIRTCGILLPKQARYQLRYTPIFLFCFFLKNFRVSLLCPPAIRLAQADHGTCVILIYPAGFVKRVIGRATVAAPCALMHTQRKTPPLWLTPGRWYSLGAKISPGTAGWTGSGHRYPAARLRWSCLRSRGAWPAARPPKRLHRN